MGWTVYYMATMPLCVQTYRLRMKVFPFYVNFTFSQLACMYTEIGNSGHLERKSSSGEEDWNSSVFKV